MSGIYGLSPMTTCVTSALQSGCKHRLGLRYASVVTGQSGLATARFKQKGYQ